MIGDDMRPPPEREQLLVRPGSDEAERLPAPPIESPPPQPGLLELLADRARTRSFRELAITALGGIVNASFFGVHLGVWWLASLFMAVGAYGVWGAADRVLIQRRAAEREGVADGVLETVRGVSIVAGVIGVVAAVLGFFMAGLPNWGMSG